MSATVLEPSHVHPSIATRRPDPASMARPSMFRLTGIELRKAVDTRSGRVLLVVVGLGLAGIGWRLLDAQSAPVSFERFLSTAMIGVQLVLPVVGVLAMTSEWTQRTALSTFTTTSRRGRVLAAKVGSAVLLGVIATGLVVAATALGTLVAGAMTGTDPTWDDPARLVGGMVIANVLNLLMAAGFGALIAQTAGAVTAFLVAPALWTVAGPALFGDVAEWLNVFGAFGRLSAFDAADLPQTLTALSAWVAVPLAVGVVTSLRREVK